MHPQRMYRSLLAGVLVAAIALAGCGGGDKASGPSCERTDAAFGEPSTRLTFRVPDATPAQVRKARGILCDRLEGIGVEHRVLRAGDDLLTVELPRAGAAGLADRPGGASIFGPGRLAIYDWEVNVIGPDGAPAPRDAAVTGGPAAGQAGALSLYDAVRRAAQRPAVVEDDNARAGSLFYAVDPKTREVAGSTDVRRAGSPTRAAALATVPASLRDRAKVLEVKPDTVIVRAEGAADGDAANATWYVLRDDVALRGSEIENPRQRFAEGPGATGEPVVTFDISAEGASSWQRLTREVADRGSRLVGLRPAAEANQHFAVVVDDELLSVPYIDHRRNPDGIDGRHGSLISGGFTIASARELAALLAGEPLPAPLELVATRAVP